MSNRTKVLLFAGYAIGIAVLILFNPKVGAEQGRDNKLLQPRVNPMLQPAVTPPRVSMENVNRIATQRQSLTLERLRPILVTSPGAEYPKEVVKKHSHYFDPITDADGLKGRSRRWGDADLAVQVQCIVRLLDELRSARFTESEIAFAIALCRCESGFNPDAAAGTTSASGLGQFVDRTREILCKRGGVKSSDPFEVELNVICMRETLKECFAFARKHAKPGTSRYFEYAYAYHHDGPSLESGGRDIAKKKVLPWLETARKCIFQ